MNMFDFGNFGKNLYESTNQKLIKLFKMGHIIIYLLLLQSRCLQSSVSAPLVQALRLCTGRTAHRGSRGIALLYRH
jgi:hypothetical protein